MKCISGRLVSRALLLGLSVVGLGGLGGCEPTSDSANATYPRRPIKLIVPFAAGGGSDTFGRILRDAIERNELLPERMVIINVPGAGGTIGSRRVKNARPDGYTILLLHDGILTAKHAGQAVYGPEAFDAIAGTGNSTQVIAVAGDSPHQDLKSLMQAASRDDSVVFSANIGAPSHFAGLMLESRSPGATFRYTQTGGGAKRFAALQGGHVDVSSFSIAEYLQFRSSGMRALALLAPERDPSLADLSTAREQGFDVISENMQFWWAPRGTPSDHTEILSTAIARAMQTPEVRERLAEMSIDETVLVGDSLQDEVERRENRIAAVATTSDIELPNFPNYVLMLFVGTIALATWRHTKRDVVQDADRQETSLTPALPMRSGLLAMVALLTVGYVAVLQWTTVGYVIATMAFVAMLGTLLAFSQSQQVGQRIWRTGLHLATIVVVMSFFVHYLFTQVLVIDLP